MDNPDPASAASPRSPVLVADDDPDTLELLRCILAGAGYVVLAAHDGGEALRLAREHLPRACILDVVMPTLGGMDVVRALRSEAPTAEIPVMMLSASVQDSEVAAALKAGASDYMTKPFSSAVLIRRLAALLDRR